MGASDLGAAVIEEINYVRGHPSDYAAHLRAERGSAAAQEAASDLQSLAPTGPLAPNVGLASAAAEHAADAGAHGLQGHDGRDGSSAFDRMHRHGVWAGIEAEELSFGQSSAASVVHQLIVDNGVPGHRHRRDLLEPKLTRAGAACASAVSGMVCVVDLASAPPPTE
jgi:uncharacterized protein YkwD